MSLILISLTLQIVPEYGKSGEDNPLRHMMRFYKCLAHMGLFRGLYFFYLYLSHRVFRSTRMRVKKIYSRNLPHPIWLRPGLSDWIVFERIFFDKEYDPASHNHDKAVDALSSRIVGRGRRPVIVDCGANIGLASIWLSQRFPDSIIVAVEPDPSNFAILELNAKSYGNIVPKNAAISDRLSRVEICSTSAAPWASQVSEAENGSIEAITIDSISHSYGQEDLLLVKVDIEGFEINLFRENTSRWVDTLPLMIFEAHDWLTPWAGSGDSFIAALARKKRDYLIKGENIFSYLHDAFRNGDIAARVASETRPST